MIRQILILFFLGLTFIPLVSLAESGSVTDSDLCLAYLGDVAAVPVKKVRGMLRPSDKDIVIELRRLDAHIARLDRQIEKLEPFAVRGVDVGHGQFYHHVMGLPLQIELFSRQLELREEVVRLEEKAAEGAKNARALKKAKKLRDEHFLEIEKTYPETNREILEQQLDIGRDGIEQLNSSLGTAVWGVWMNGYIKRFGFTEDDMRGDRDIGKLQAAIRRFGETPHVLDAAQRARRELSAARAELQLLQYKAEQERLDRKRSDTTKEREALSKRIMDEIEQLSAEADRLREQEAVLQKDEEISAKQGVAAWMEATSGEHDKDGDMGNLMALAAAERGSDANIRAGELGKKRAVREKQRAEIERWIEQRKALLVQLSESE